MHAHKARVAGLLVLISLMATPRISPAAEIEGVRFADTYEASGTTLKLQCVGLLRYKILFKGYVAAFYLGAGATPDEALADVPKRIELSYFWGIDGEDFGPVGESILEQNFGRKALEALRPQLEQIDRLYEDVQPGDRYSLTYVPGVGTELALNGKPKGTIAGADFAAKYFAIWLGRHPLDASLRDQLIGCSRQS